MADIDILDLFNGETKKYTSSNTEIAPVELMAQVQYSLRFRKL